jgi:GNAT superfamily N-acetyltransferase
MNTTLTIRRSQPSECGELRAVQEASMRELGRTCYDESVIEAFLAHVGTLDATLIEDGTFFSARIGRVLVATGGWTYRTPSYARLVVGGSEHGSRPGVTIRSIFVHPAWARRGIARRMMSWVEDDIRAAGHESVGLTATLVGIPFYRSLGYRGEDPSILRLPGDKVFVGLNMEKRLEAFSRAA